MSNALKLLEPDDIKGRKKAMIKTIENRIVRFFFVHKAGFGVFKINFCLLR